MELSSKNDFPGRPFIVEGIDGSGKSTQLSLLHRWLESEGHAVVFSEWNSSPLVRKLTQRGKKKKLLTPMTFSLIHATDFANRTEHQIIPPLKATNAWSRSLGWSSPTPVYQSRSNQFNSRAGFGPRSRPKGMLTPFGNPI
jgi:hypothetical protein